MFVGSRLVSLVLAGIALITPKQGPVVRLDNAVGHRFLRTPFGRY